MGGTFTETQKLLAEIEGDREFISRHFPCDKRYVSRAITANRSPHLYGITFAPSGRLIIAHYDPVGRGITGHSYSDDNGATWTLVKQEK